MNQQQFAAAVGPAGGVYIPFAGTDEHYELVGIGVVTGNVNNRIRVTVLNSDGLPAFNVWVRHSFGSDFERFQFNGEPVQFNLGAGSHYSPPNDPPDHITIEAPTDEVRVGNSSTIGFAHTEWAMTFKLTGGGPTPPPPGDFVTRQEFEAYKQKVRDANV